MSGIKVLLIMVCLTLLGAFLRLNNIIKNPVSLNIDEVSYGYSAYSILKTGHDENGIFMPLTFRSTGDYKDPVLIYSLVPMIAIFGLNEFSVRITTAILGILTIPVFFMLASTLTGNKKVALVATVLLAISPWHIYYSRFASASLMGLFFLILGMWFFVKREQSKIWAILASLVLALSMYTYHSLKLFIPLFLASLIFIQFKKGTAYRKNLISFTATGFIFILPLLYLMVFGGVNTRAGMVFLTQDIDYTRYVILDHLHRNGEIFLLFLFWVKRYLNYFQPDFLFFNGLNMTTVGTLGMGVLYLFELPWLVLGIAELITKHKDYIKLVILWILLGLLPTSWANNEQSALRSLIILPMVILVVSFGALRFFQLITKVNKYWKFLLAGGYFVFMVIILMQAFLVFTVHFPKQRGEAFMEGTKESILDALANKEKYQEIVYDPYRGVEAPYIVNIPYMYILFYSQYDPAKFQTEPKQSNPDLYKFDKFTIRKIDWRMDRNKVGTLFIGSPWSLPEKDIKPQDILQKIYLSGGQLALMAVSPH